ncbi:hypothetical protein, partial [Vibrio parahaemolyticus]|uniref:hypothetical protein n=1 Tax=Vibrio parahaemolyticus TaxID=670 RepID=UPI0011683C0D
VCQYHELSGGTIWEVFAVGPSFTGSNFIVIVLSRGFFFFVAKLYPLPLSHFAKSVLSVGFETLASGFTFEFKASSFVLNSAPCC